MVTILKQQSGGTLQSWNIHNPLPVMAACIILFLSWFRFFIIDLMASTWRRDNQPPCSAKKSGCFSVSPDRKTQWPHATGFSQSTLAFSRGENETRDDHVCVCLLWISANKQWCRLLRLCYHCQISPLYIFDYSDVASSLMAPLPFAFPSPSILLLH